MEKEEKLEPRAFRYLLEIYAQAQIVSDRFTISAGGDEAIFTGSTNDIANLREALNAVPWDMRVELDDVREKEE